jgi:hypothetical protein
MVVGDHHVVSLLPAPPLVAGGVECGGAPELFPPPEAVPHEAGTAPSLRPPAGPRRWLPTIAHQDREGQRQATSRCLASGKSVPDSLCVEHSPRIAQMVPRCVSSALRCRAGARMYGLVDMSAAQAESRREEGAQT